MSLECGECEGDARGDHADSCSRHPYNRIAKLERELATEKRVRACAESEREELRGMLADPVAREFVRLVVAKAVDQAIAELPELKRVRLDEHTSNEGRATDGLPVDPKKPHVFVQGPPVPDKGAHPGGREEGECHLCGEGPFHPRHAPILGTGGIVKGGLT